MRGQSIAATYFTKASSIDNNYLYGYFIVPFASLNLAEPVGRKSFLFTPKIYAIVMN